MYVFAQQVCSQF